MRTLFINLLIVALLCAADCSAESRNTTSSFYDYSKGDTDTVGAILLYNSLTTNSVYDYDAVKEQAVTDVEDFKLTGKNK